MIKLFVKILLHSGVPFGLLISLFLFLQGETQNIIQMGVLAGLLFGSLVAYILVTIHKSLSRAVVPENFDHDFDIFQRRIIQMNIPYEKAFDFCSRSLQAISKSRVLSRDISSGEIRAKTGLNWKTWGDDIDFKLSKGRGAVTVHISSRPSAKSTLVDFGKNLDNVERLKKFLKEHADLKENL